MSEEVPAVHPSLDNSPAHAAVDQEAEQIQAEHAAKQEIQDAEAAKASENEVQTDKFAQKFAALTRREKAARAREAEIERRLAEIEEMKAKVEDTYKSKYIDPEVLERDPLGVLNSRGLTPEKLADMILNDGKQSPERMIQEYEAKLAARIEELDRKYEEKLSAKELEEEQKKVQAVTDNFVKELTTFVNDTEDYELIRANNAVELVYETIDKYYNETVDENGENGTILSNKEACDLVEEYLLDEAKKVWEKANKKLSGAFAPKQPEVQEQKGQSPTLSNAMSASASKSADPSLLPDDVSKREIAKLIKWID